MRYIPRDTDYIHHRLSFMNSKIKVITHALMSRIGIVTKSSKNLVNIRDLLGLDYMIIKITFSFALAMLAISIALWLIGNGGNK